MKDPKYLAGAPRLSALPGAEFQAQYVPIQTWLNREAKERKQAPSVFLPGVVL